MSTPMLRTLAAAALGAAAITLAACGGGTGGGSSVPLDDLVTQVTATECAVATRCRFVSDLALCEAVYGPGIYERQLFNDFGAAVATAKAGKARYDGTAARACLDAIKNIACRDTTGGPAACDQVFTGTVPDGGRCISDAACLRGSFCAPPTSADTPCDGICTAAGTMCNSDSQCGSGRVCDQSMATTTSQGGCATPTAPGAAGQPCGTNNRCTPGFFCSSTGTCMAPAHAGEACTGARNGFSCAEGLLCIASGDGTSSTCVAVAAKGDTCTTGAECGGSLTSLGCDPASHVCVDLPSSGPCLGTGIFSCNLLSSFCDTTMATPTCQPFVGLGASCSTSNLGQCGTILVSPGPTCPSTTGTTSGICTASAGPPACDP